MAIVRSRNIFDPGSETPFKLSRSKLELLLQCPRCFYIDRRRGVGRPQGPPFNLNIAVDTLLKKEFDIHRAGGTQHPLLEHYGVDARPAAHEELDAWRENFQGIQYHHAQTNLLITGAIDDLWINSREEYIVVDYKATSKGEVIDKLQDTRWHDAYRRQMEIYQWLLRQKGYRVSPTGYFVYCNAGTDGAAFDGKLEFDVRLIPYEGDDSWVEGVVFRAKECLLSETLPPAGKDCEYCAFADARRRME
ncbi:MAG: PD-(D/E)XK nuclease family protein [Candidatus Moraniibacteriota bacterium]